MIVQYTYLIKSTVRNSYRCVTVIEIEIILCGQMSVKITMNVTVYGKVEPTVLEGF